MPFFPVFLLKVILGSDAGNAQKVRVFRLKEVSEKPCNKRGLFLF